MDTEDAESAGYHHAIRPSGWRWAFCRAVVAMYRAQHSVRSRSPFSRRLPQGRAKRMLAIVKKNAIGRRALAAGKALFFTRDTGLCTFSLPDDHHSGSTGALPPNVITKTAITSSVRSGMVFDLIVSSADACSLSAVRPLCPLANEKKFALADNAGARWAFRMYRSFPVSSASLPGAPNNHWKRTGIAGWARETRRTVLATRISTAAHVMCDQLLRTKCPTIRHRKGRSDAYCIPHADMPFSG